MLKIEGQTWPPTPSNVAFSERSGQMLERDSGHHDRTTEIGANVGDFLEESMPRGPAYSIAEKLTADLADPRQVEAFMLGVGNTLPGYADYMKREPISASHPVTGANLIPTDMGPIEDGGAVGL